MRELEFEVTICLGGGDGGSVCVTVDVSDEEYDLLKQCCFEDEEIVGYEGLEELVERIQEAAADENERCLDELGEDEEIDYDSVSYMISFPEEIMDDEDEEDEYEDED